MPDTIYFDCFSGCSGDMLLGALIDAGLSPDDLRKELSKLDLHDYEIEVNRVTRSGISATKADVITKKSHEHEGGHHHARSLKDILQMIDSSSLSEAVKEKSSRIFCLIGDVEAKIHNTDVESVHFHEIGAVDSIIDIVGAIIGFELMGIEKFYASPLQAGGGMVKMAHGLYPVPAPATLSIISLRGAPLADSSIEGVPQSELLTPTGAAIVTSLAVFERPLMSVDKIGYGAGGKEFKDWPNVLRVWVGSMTDIKKQSGLTLLETNIDDMNPQICGYVMEKLFGAGALDVWYTPIQMKKNRPAVMLSALVEEKNEADAVELIMKETTTMGIRISNITRHVAAKETIELETEIGRIKVKVKRSGGKITTASPEYEDCKRAAEERSLPLQSVFRLVNAEIKRLFPDI